MTPSDSKNCFAFSLVEVSIALAIAAVALLSIIGLIPTATKGSADSADQTAVGTMLEDIDGRIKNHVLEPGAVSGSPFFYDLRGGFCAPDADSAKNTSIVTDRFYRVEVQLIKPNPAAAASAGFGEALAVQVKIFWPIDESGEALRPSEPGSEITFLAGAVTGPGWTDVDSSYQPKIE